MNTALELHLFYRSLANMVKGPSNIREEDNEQVPTAHLAQAGGEDSPLFLHTGRHRLRPHKGSHRGSRY